MDIQRIIERIAPGWHHPPGASAAAIAGLAASLGRELPADYRELLAWTDGGEGPVGDLYLAMWPVEQVKQLGDDYRVTFYVPGVVAVGSNSGPYCYALDYRDPDRPPAFVQIPVGDLGPDTVEVLGASLSDALGRALAG